MPLYKSAQLMDVNDDFESFGDEDEVVLYDEKPSKDDVIEMHSPSEEGNLEISFKLPPLPGSDADIPIEVSTDDDMEVENKGKGKDKNDLKPGEELEVKDPGDYRSYQPKDLTQWAQYMFSRIPRHTGRETTGIERVISYLDRFDGDLSRAIKSDYKGEADIGKLEEARREIYNGKERLQDALDKLSDTYSKKKKGDLTFGEIVKEAKQTQIGGIVITVPILISRIASVLINGMVSGGHDIEKMFDKQVKEWDLTKREQAELMELLDQMGYAQPRRDRGYGRDHKMDYTSSDNFDFGANYSS
jgi:hypothetical protein